MQCCPAMTRRRGNKSHPLLTSPLSETQVSGYRRRLRLHALSPWNDLTNRQRAARTETRGVPSEQGRVMYRIPPLPSMPFNASSPGIREDGVLKKKKNGLICRGVLACFLRVPCQTFFPSVTFDAEKSTGSSSDFFWSRAVPAFFPVSYLLFHFRFC